MNVFACGIVQKGRLPTRATGADQEARRVMNDQDHSPFNIQHSISMGMCHIMAIALTMGAMATMATMLLGRALTSQQLHAWVVGW